MTIGNISNIPLQSHRLNNPFFLSTQFSPTGVGVGMGKIIPIERKKELLPYVKSNLGKVSQRKIARRLNLGKTTINRWSKELGFTQTKHTVDENFFDSWTEFSVYVLGYIYADGNVSWNPTKSYRALTITASAKDKKHLEKVRNLMKSSKPLLYARKTNSYRLIVNNKKIVTKLMDLGVYPNKSLTVKFPSFIPTQLMSHFLRGIIDGDGNVRYVKRKKSPYFEITIASGSQDFCNGLVNSIKEIIDVGAKPRKVNGNTYVVQYSCSRGKNLARFIYSNASISIERKQNEYNTYLEEHKK